MCDVVIAYKLYTDVIGQHALTHTHTHTHTHTLARARSLGLMYEYGEGGLPINHTRALIEYDRILDLDSLGTWPSYMAIGMLHTRQVNSK